MRISIKKITAGLVLAGIMTVSGCFGLSNQSLTPSTVRTYDYSSMHLVQLEEPKEGQPTAEIETTLGTIKAVLYPDYAPNTVSNFINRANDGFYNGKDIYYILDKSIFMTGAADEKRNSGFTEDGQLIANEYSVDLWPFRGSFCAFNGRMGYGDSRFFVVNKRELTEEQLTDLRAFTNDKGQNLPEELINAFVEKGVIIDFAGAYTVFAQTIEGFDVIDTICGLDVSGEFSMPAEPVYINKITIGEYHSGN